MGACISSMVRRIKQVMEACVSSMVRQIKKQAMETRCVSSEVWQKKQREQAMEIRCVSSEVWQKQQREQAMETRCVSSEVWQKKQREQGLYMMPGASSGHDYIDRKVKIQITSALGVRDNGENIIGLCGPKKRVERSALTAIRTAEKDQLFQKIVTTTVTKKPDITKIQTEIGYAIGLNFNSKRMITAERADLLCAKMKELQTVLIVMYDLHGRLNLGEIGIPFGEDHNGCKILLTSTSLEVLSEQMKVHKLIQL
ncbi:hypothetical protein MtrunA17_Chr8g0379721 [Medicago truncatula]|uniref:NB-ARC domain disease resistance protein n=1 Tax=Medicago truncatula TaxID=3880 RepID=B7FKW5_MEDTR|nr:probable disease resistance protein At5g47260 isoform X4 [Medicago truncatula]ACJ85399.1 unknown [Medicago truncatula]AET04326.2 NB-ARC domain disease resistance protein [Medicago truncatula]AFK39594.1 unknown [Medicago truncatula]RHN42689.1 hypothetical protein MtrunA17_Chr8g0379721 [Medicago truncatula]